MAYKQDQQKAQIKNLASLPLDKAYNQVMGPLRFEYMSMKKDQKDKE